jgi:hypothetical protein
LRDLGQRAVKENLDCGQVDKPNSCDDRQWHRRRSIPFAAAWSVWAAQLGNVLSSEDTAKYWAAIGRNGLRVRRSRIKAGIPQSA